MIELSKQQLSIVSGGASVADAVQTGAVSGAVIGGCIGATFCLAQIAAFTSLWDIFVPSNKGSFATVVSDWRGISMTAMYGLIGAATLALVGGALSGAVTYMAHTAFVND